MALDCDFWVGKVVCNECKPIICRRHESFESVVCCLMLKKMRVNKATKASAGGKLVIEIVRCSE